MYLSMLQNSQICALLIFTEKKSKKTDTPGKPPKYPLF